jgi:hypothetical protein
MVFHRPAGDEVFRLGSATFRAIRYEDGFELSFHVRAEKGAIKSLPDTASFPAQPNAEVSVFVDEFDPAALVGRRFKVPRSYDEEREDHVSCLYYYEHRDFNRIVVEVLGARGKRLHVRWSGTTDDVDRYDGRGPADRVVIEGMFEFLDGEERK